MSDLISREEAIKIVKHYGACNKCDSRNGDMCDACRVGEEITAIQNAPTIEAEPRKHGKPIPLNVTYEFEGKVYARQYSSECPFCGDSGAKNYCPNCGAKMDLDEVENG